MQNQRKMPIFFTLKLYNKTCKRKITFYEMFEKELKYLSVRSKRRFLVIAITGW